MKREGAKKAAAASSRPANRSRGEHEIKLDGLVYPLRPSFTAQVAIETHLDKTYVELATAAQVGAIKILDARVVVAELINAAVDDPLGKVSIERVGEMIYEAGIPYVAPIIAVALIDALSGGRTASGEAKAVAVQ